MRFVAISDTHGKHKDLVIPSGDILIHAGDMSRNGEESEVVDFMNWFSNQNFKLKILIAGNHDFYFERESDEQIQKIIPSDVIYLNDSAVTINDFKIWGSPITPWFFNWAFNRHRGEQIKTHWDLIPKDTDVLITHGPMFRMLDKNIESHHVGCKDLYNRINEIKPKIHICGHIHEAYGEINQSETKFINASMLNEKYELINKPINFEL